MPESARSARVDVVAVLDRLRTLEASVATAESLTAGLLCARLADVPGASEVLRGAVVAYAPQVKIDLLLVPADLLDAVGTVSGGTALAMATGVRARLQATYAVATTGVAGPDPYEGHPAGTVHVAVAGPRGAAQRRLRLPGDRAEVRAAAVEAALLLLSDVLAREPSALRD